MNWLEKEVPKLELCQELKELGYPQDGEGYYWVKTKEGWKLAIKISNLWRIVGRYLGEKDEESIRFGGCHCCAVDLEIEEKIKAPTCREMEEWLVQDFYGCFFHTAKWKDTWFVYYMDKRGDLWFPNLSKAEVEGKNEPDARAKMLIWLVKNKYISFKERKKNV